MITYCRKQKTRIVARHLTMMYVMINYLHTLHTLRVCAKCHEEDTTDVANEGGKGGKSTRKCRAKSVGCNKNNRHMYVACGV